MATWNPNQYMKYRGDRTRPALDLVNQIPLENPKDIVDLGCGTGTSTRVLSNKWLEATIEGIDSSEEMLQKAISNTDRITWTCSDLNKWVSSKKYDIIFSNAAFQWVRPIEPLIQRCIKSLNRDGVLAFQVPNNEGTPYHLCILEVVNRSKWKPFLKGVESPLRYDSMNLYLNLLSGNSFKINAWETRYYQIVDSAESIVEWVSGTGLLPYLQAIPEEILRTEFKNELLELYRSFFSTTVDGMVLFPFNRQFVVAQNQKFSQ